MELFNNPSVAFIFLPALLFAIAFEAFILILRRKHYPWRASLSSLAIAAGHSLSGATTNKVITTGLAFIVWKYRIATIDMSHWYHIALLFILIEFAYYWYHRSAHRIRLLWASHSVHHSPEELTLSAAYRLNWTPIISGSWIFFLPLVLIGFHPLWVFGMVSASLLYQFWLHTTLVPQLGPFEWVFNTPSAHRVHHASNNVYLDRNYGGVLVVFDRLFGTYVKENTNVPIKFGLVHPMLSFNPLVIVFHEFGAMLRDLWRAETWQDRFGYVFAPSGWRPKAEATVPGPSKIGQTQNA